MYTGVLLQIAFNPVTVNAMKKLLTKVLLLEKCRLSSESISAIAESSAGDIRQALTALQFLCLGCNSHNPHQLMWDPGGLGSSQFGSRSLHTKGTGSDAGVGAGRDYSLSLFHALGKFLHNKRRAEEQFDAGGFFFCHFNFCFLSMVMRDVFHSRETPGIWQARARFHT